MQNSVLQETLLPDFQKLFASINKIFILAGRMSTRLLFYEVLTLSSHFLISERPKF